MPSSPKATLILSYIVPCLENEKTILHIDLIFMLQIMSKTPRHVSFNFKFILLGGGNP